MLSYRTAQPVRPCRISDALSIEPSPSVPTPPSDNAPTLLPLKHPFAALVPHTLLMLLLIRRLVVLL